MAQKLEDFGEKIGGAAKDRWRLYAEKLDRVADRDMGQHSISDIWPAPNWQAELDNGADPVEMAYIHALRDLVPNKPQRSTKIAKWVSTITELRSMARNILLGQVSIQDHVATIEQDPKLWDFALRAHAFLSHGHDISSKVMMSRTYQPTRFFDPKNFDKTGVHIQIKNVIGQNFFDLDEAKAYVAKNILKGQKLTTATSAKRAASRFKLFRDQPAKCYYVGFKPPGEIYPARMKVFGPDVSKDEAFAWMRENSSVLEASFEARKKLPDWRSQEDSPRIGPDWRHGKDVSPEVFQFVFNLRAGEFGNWVGKGLRQQLLNAAYDGFMDMAFAMDVPPSCIGLGGRLAIGFGSRGRGGVGAASAHYEPDRTVINLTKKYGEGSLAHEWAHALDNLVDRDVMSSGVTGYGSERRSAPSSCASGGLHRIYAGFQSETRLVERSKACDEYRSKAYFGTGREIFARAFETWIRKSIHDVGGSNDFVANILGEQSAEKDRTQFQLETLRYPYPLPEEFPAMEAIFETNLLSGPLRDQLLSYQNPELEHQIGFPEGELIDAQKAEALREERRQQYDATDRLDAVENSAPMSEQLSLF